jgi:ubiquinol-cytochrome c reductase iron-sulfur subunit
MPAGKGRARDALISAVALVAGRRRRRLGAGERERLVPDSPPSSGAELAALVLLAAGAACGVAFVVVYALDRLPNQTQLFGACLGLAFLFVAAALILTGKRLIVTEELEHDYPVEEHADEQETILQTVADSGSRLTRRRLFKACLGAAGGALTVAVLTPLASLGPVLDVGAFYDTPWRRGRRLVDERGRPWRADDIEEADFYTAFPEGADKEQLGAPVVLVRLPQHELHLPRANAHFAADGIVAYSKICTHAGCAISLYRSPLFRPNDPRPALVCPCHYSTFDPAAGGTVLFGPAGRNLPMLPLSIDRRGELRAAGNFDGPVGPSWWGVRLRKARS